MTTPIDGSIQAEFADGYVLDETEHEDVSPHDSQHNIFRDILMKWSEPKHGKMVRFSVFWKDRRYDINWTDMPDNARPIRYKHNNRSLDLDTGEQKFWTDSIGFGYQYTDENGENVQEVREM